MIIKMFCIYSEIVMLPEAFGTSLFHNKIFLFSILDLFSTR
ncbi:hypothetical protein Gotur_028144 [Gossypium turneri]